MNLKKQCFQIFILSFLILLCACAKKVKPDQEQPPPAVASNSVAEAAPQEASAKYSAGLETVHFAFDSSAIDAASKDVLRSNAKFLKEHSEIHLQIEGHCDQRGGTQYNLALGERRAKAVKKFLASIGIASSRITTISMGKEKPADPAETEEAYAKNRRAVFVVTD